MFEKFTRSVVLFDTLMAIEIKNMDGKPVSKRTLAKEMGMITDHVKSLILPLVNDGMIRSVKGAKGGYLIDRMDVTALSIYNLIHPEGVTCHYKDSPEIVGEIIGHIDSVIEQELINYKLS